ncbi:MAG: hypothetical protein HC880_04840 [Bacteroidia bacterium]|nr:hypothetical protein [Bacteroidia bacterium]
MKGAGGTDGGTGRFLLGLIMLVGGTYLLLRSIHVNFHLGYSLYSYGSFHVTSGFVLIPFMFGVGMVFYNARNIIGWLLTGGSLVALIFGVLVSTQFSLRHMDAFELLLILVLTVGGLGIFLSSFRSFSG